MSAAEAHVAFEIQTSFVHPLLQPIIVQNLFQFLRAEDVLKARSVCRLWNQLGTPVLQRKMDRFTIHLSKTETSGRNWRRIAKYTDMTKGSKLKFTRFEFDSDLLIDELGPLLNFRPRKHKTIKQLSMNYMDFDQSYVLSSASFRNLLLLQAPFLQRLELLGLPSSVKSQPIFHPTESVQLQLKCLIVDVTLDDPEAFDPDLDDPIEPYSEAFFEDIFRASPDLEEMWIFGIKKYGDANEESEVAEPLMILRQLVAHGRPETLSKLYLSAVDDRTIQLLLTVLKTSPLTSFSVSSFDLSQNVVLETFLASHQNTLQKLDLGFRRTEKALFSFPILQMLTSLKLSVVFPLFRLLDYGTLFPKLEVLEIAYEEVSEGCRFDLERIFSAAATVCPSLRHLELRLRLDHCSMLETIGDIFPNVIKMNLGAQKWDMLPQLWESWPNMEYLAMSVILPTKSGKNKSRRTLDSVFSGLSEETCRELKKQPKTWSFETLHSLRKKPSISSLKNLKYLLVLGGPEARLKSDQLMTDLTAYSSFRALKNLTFLQIDHNTHEMSQSCLRDLCSELELLLYESPKELKLVKYEWQNVEDRFGITCGSVYDYHGYFAYSIHH